MPSVKPQIIATQDFENYASQQCPEIFNVSETVDTKQSFTWSAGFSLLASTSFTVGIPLVAEDDTTIDVQTTFTDGGTESSEDQKHFDSSFTVVCPPCSTVH